LAGRGVRAPSFAFARSDCARWRARRAEFTAPVLGTRVGRREAHGQLRLRETQRILGACDRCAVARGPGRGDLALCLPHGVLEFDPLGGISALACCGEIALRRLEGCLGAVHRLFGALDGGLRLRARGGRRIAHLLVERGNGIRGRAVVLVGVARVEADRSQGLLQLGDIRALLSRAQRAVGRQRAREHDDRTPGDLQCHAERVERGPHLRHRSGHDGRTFQLAGRHFHVDRVVEAGVTPELHGVREHSRLDRDGDRTALPRCLGSAGRRDQCAAGVAGHEADDRGACDDPEQSVASQYT
jgi:hypothetical protein